MPQPVLHTERMVLVPLADEHLELEVALDADPEVLRYLDGRARTRAEVTAFHTERMESGRRVDGLGYWAAFAAGDDFVGIMMLPPAAGESVAELGYRVARRHWRQGYAAEAARELLRHGFTTAGQSRIIAQTMAVNAGSRGVMAKVGLRYQRTFFPDLPPIPGSEEGEVEYAISRDEWLALTRTSEAGMA